MTSDGIRLIYDCITSNIAKMQILINNTYKDIEIQRTELVGTNIKIFVYIDESFVGRITRYKLIMKNGKVFDEKNENLVKDDTRGLLTFFEYRIREV